jgi:tRNA(Arg) A34 adenosine deaminase TadA
MSKKRYVITTTAFDRRGNTLAKKQNNYSKSHPLQKAMSLRAGMHEERTKLHAEVACIIAAAKTRKKIHTLFIERYDAEGRPKLAQPCPSCMKGISLAGIRQIIYTTEEGREEVGLHRT